MFPHLPWQQWPPCGTSPLVVVHCSIMSSFKPYTWTQGICVCVCIILSLKMVTTGSSFPRCLSDGVHGEHGVLGQARWVTLWETLIQMIIWIHVSQTHSIMSASVSQSNTDFTSVPEACFTTHCVLILLCTATVVGAGFKGPENLFFNLFALIDDRPTGAVCFYLRN